MENECRNRECTTVKLLLLIALAVLSIVILASPMTTAMTTANVVRTTPIAPCTCNHSVVQMDCVGTTCNTYAFCEQMICDQYNLEE